VSYVPEPENSALLKCSLNIFRKFNRYPEALRLALMLNDVELVENIFTSCKDMYVGSKAEQFIDILFSSIAKMVFSDVKKCLFSKDPNKCHIMIDLNSFFL